MNSIELGKRIKEARIARKMTQSELVGDFITRNMLSRIESGNACPSVKTLEYLANRLELPPGSLMDNMDDVPQTDGKVNETLIICKKKYISKSYSDAAELAKQLIDSDFSSALICQSEIKNIELKNVKLVNSTFFKTPLKDVNLTDCIIDGLIVSDNGAELRGATVDVYQAAMFAKLLGLNIE